MAFFWVHVFSSNEFSLQNGIEKIMSSKDF